MKFLAALVIVGTLTSSLLADEPQAKESPKETQEQPTSFWMEKKMEYSQAVLRGLATGDFEAIRDNAAHLGLLNRVEGFIRRRNVDYSTHLHSFQRITDELLRQATNKNLEGSTLAFNQLTVSCVKCHQSMRNEIGDEQLPANTPAENPKTSE